MLLPGEELKLPALGRLDVNALREGRVKVRYRALDPVWREEPNGSDGMILLREHVKRLCLAADELSHWGSSGEWRGVSENLYLAASLNDLSADTDINDTSMWCGTAAEFEDANSEVAEKHLAGVIVFNLVWAAYEGAVEVVSEPFGMKQPKGARGRELLARLIGDRHFPYLRAAVLAAFELHKGHATDFNTREMRRLIAAGSIAAIGAEYLREFRNAVAHGAINKPTPEDWGAESEYRADEDPAIRQFHANTRIALLLIQILMRSTIDARDELTVWLSNPQPGTLLLTQLHCILPERLELELPLLDAPLIEDDW